MDLCISIYQRDGKRRITQHKKIRKGGGKGKIGVGVKETWTFKNPILKNTENQ